MEETPSSANYHSVWVYVDDDVTGRRTIDVTTGHADRKQPLRDRRDGARILMCVFGSILNFWAHALMAELLTSHRWAC
jgi:hypothetical protein